MRVYIFTSNHKIKNCNSRCRHLHVIYLQTLIFVTSIISLCSFYVTPSQISYSICIIFLNNYEVLLNLSVERVNYLSYHSASVTHYRQVHFCYSQYVSYDVRHIIPYVQVPRLFLKISLIKFSRYLLIAMFPVFIFSSDDKALNIIIQNGQFNKEFWTL